MNASFDPCARPNDAPRRPQIASCRARCAAVTEVDLEPPGALHRWSVEHYRDFWRTFLDWASPAWEGSADLVCTSDDVEHATFFPDVRLNYAENLLRPLPGVDEEAPAVTAVHGDGSVERLSRASLRRRVQATATELAEQGVAAGDRVVVIAPNNARAVVVALAVVALGATVSLALPDMGPSALLGRFEQIDPRLLVLDRGSAAGWEGTAGDKLTALVSGLPGLAKVLVVDDGALPVVDGPDVGALDAETERMADHPAPWPRFPFNHPIFVMFTSGTTGPPKAMLHGAGGTLLEHVKEHRLHIDLDADDVFFHHTTTAWMVWNRQLSALATGAGIVVYDGPVRGPETLWRLVADHGVTVFGTSPAYLQLCEDSGYRPAAEVDLRRLRAVLTTGSVLHDWQYDWFAAAVGPQPLQSIGGGTDILGAFVLGHPELPEIRGRSRARSLGLDVVAVDEDGREVVGVVGELVCRNPFPSRPVAFLNDPDGRRFHEAYFVQHPGVWTHGDLIDVAADGSVRFHGRSDGVLNIDGVRIGPTEIYRILGRFPEIAAAMAVEQRDPGHPGSSRLVLLVVLSEGHRLDDHLAERIRAELRREGSPSHVPSLVVAVPELPTTHNGKLSERAARDALNGEPPRNTGALRNPGSLQEIVAAVREAARPVPSVPVASRGERGAETVARLFQEVLGHPLGETANFFDAGGTSRQSMTLLRRLRMESGRAVSMDTFMADPSIRGLGDALDRTPAVAVHEVSVLLLRAGSDPSAVPLFLVQGVHGDVDLYRFVVSNLETAGDVYGVFGAMSGADGERLPVAEVAARLVEAITAVDAVQGPIALAGYSFGGLVAYEMARLFEAAGRRVAFLGLLDPRPPLASLTGPERLARKAASFIAIFIPGFSDTTIGTAIANRFRPQTLTSEQLMLLDSVRIARSFRLGPYGGPVTFFRASRRIPVISHLIYVWRRMAPRLKVVDVPGAHYSLLSEENAPVVAARISRALRAAERARGGTRNRTRAG